MEDDPDLDREPEDRPVHLEWDAAAEMYEHDDVDDFESEMFDALYDALGTDAGVPEPLRAALVAWYRTTEAYTLGVQYLIDEAAGR